MKAREFLVTPRNAEYPLGIVTEGIGCLMVMGQVHVIEHSAYEHLQNRIDEMDVKVRDMKIELEDFAQLQAKCYEGYATGDSVFGDRDRLKAEVERLKRLAQMLDENDSCN